ncbi:MAG TPA: histone deacetylase [Vicinamibacterales bacterium]|nr:histone deacetylase [Vicinamibacterales bacterium]
MRRLGLVTDPRFRAHDPGPHHPECPERLEVLESLFAEGDLREVLRVPVRPAIEDELTRVHRPALVRSVAASAGRDHTRYDPDTSASAGTFEAACLAAGGAIELVDAVLDGEIDSGFAALRPPGHHAEADRAMGFCFFNNVAVAAEHLRSKRGLERVLIVDWDVHHGNGTQHSFYDDRGVMYASLHQYPFYPGTGGAEEIGRGEGAGFTVNAPMPAGAGHADYMAAFRELLLPVARQFDPQFVLVSAGFDAHRDDPLASIELADDSFAAMTDALVGLADEHCRGRIALLLEGGYSLEALRTSVRSTLDALRAPRGFDSGEGALNAWGRSTRSALATYWNIG